MRVLFKSTFGWRFGHASLCDVLVDVTYVYIQQRLHCITLLLIYYGLLTDFEVVT